MKKSFFLLIILTVFIAILGCEKKKNNLEPILTDIQVIDLKSFDKIKEENAGKIMLVNFFASWCPPCRMETPDFVKVYNEYKDKNFVIVGISIDDNKEAAVDFVNEYGVSYPVFMADKALARHYNVSGIPMNVLYDKEGNLWDIKIGVISEKNLKEIAEKAAF